MKRLFLIPILLLFLSQIAWLNMGPTQPVSGVACDDCSGARIWSWHMEDDDATPDITVGNPCGCADATNDTVGAITGSPDFSVAQKSDGARALHINALDEYVEFDIGTIDPNDFKITFDIYVVTMPANDWNSFDVLGMFGDANDQVRLLLEDRGATKELSVYHYRNGAATDNTHVEVGTGAWKTSCEWQFKTGVDGNDQYLACDGDSDTGDEDPGAFDTTPTIIYFGEKGGSTAGSEYYLDITDISKSDRF
jgi:hypothetical protein